MDKFIIADLLSMRIYSKSEQYVILWDVIWLEKQFKIILGMIKSNLP